MMTRDKVRKYLSKFSRPAVVSSMEWKEMKTWAQAVWDAQLMQQPWQYTLQITCKEFFEMICTPKGQLIVKNLSLLQFADNENIRKWKEELMELSAQLIEMREESEALEWLNVVLTIDADFFPALLLKARAELLSKSYKKANVTLGVAIETQPYNPEVYLLRAQLHTVLGWYEKAVEDFDTALLFTARPEKVIRLRAQVKWTMNNRRGAILDLKKGLSYRPYDEELLLELAEKQLEIGSLNDALTSVKTILSFHPFQSQALFLKGVLMNELGAEFASKKDIHMAFLLGNPAAGKVLRAHH